MKERSLVSYSRPFSFICGQILLVFSASAATPADDALRRFVEGVQTLSAKFEQVQRDERGEVLQKSEGRVWLSRPAPAAGPATGKFRWSYEQPYQQLLVCDGRTIWLYDPDLAQVTARPAGQTLAGTPAELLSRRGLLDQQFTLSDGGREADARIVQLKPKAADSDFQSIELWLREGTPTRMRFHDALGGITEVSFSDIRTNTRLDEALFRFEPPKGVEIIRAEEPRTK